MKHLVMAIGVALTITVGQPAAADSLSKDMAARIEAIPIQTLTISDDSS